MQDTYNNTRTEIISFIQEIFQQSQKSNAAIALSGGLDSATTVMLTADALGGKRVQAYYMPSKMSHPLHRNHAQEIVKLAQIPNENFHILPINAIIQKTWRIISKNRNTLISQLNRESDASEVTKITRLKNRLRLANLTARVRMALIFDAAKLHDALVVGTENLSEHLLGYFTRYGDEASDLEPIRHLYKTQVIELAKKLGIPEAIINKKPSADLWSGQSDQNELGFTYEQADPILELISQGKSNQEIFASGHSETLVNTIKTIISNNKFKHEVPYKL